MPERDDVITPPNLAWKHLLPADVACTLDDGPSWLHDAMASSGRDDGRAVRVTWGGSAATLPSLDRCEGIVAINCRGLRAAELRRAGYGYVRRFAILPNAQALRWLIPLESAPIASSAFQLLAPIRASARIKHALARAAARSGLPLWYQDSIHIAFRSVPPLEETLRRVLSNDRIGVALSSGAPGPIERRKPSLVVVDPDGRTLAFAKVSASPLSDELVRHEADVLRFLEAAAPAVHAPHVLFAGSVDGRYVLVQSPLAGDPPRAALTPAHERLLERMRLPARKPFAATAWATALGRRLTVAPVGDRELGRMFGSVARVLHDEPLPAAVVHGDFVPWNLRESRGTLAACDWENASLDGLALVDEIHHRLVVGHLMLGWSAARAQRELYVLARTHPLGVAPAHVTAVALACVLDFVLRLVDHGHADSDPMVAWYRELAGRLEHELGSHATAGAGR